MVSKKKLILLILIVLLLLFSTTIVVSNRDRTPEDETRLNLSVINNLLTDVENSMIKNSEKFDELQGEVDSLNLEIKILRTEQDLLKKTNDEYRKRIQELNQQKTELGLKIDLKHGVDATDNKVCRVQPDSELCTNPELLKKIQQIAQDKSVDYRLLIGISFAESKLGTARAPKNDCKYSNNRGGMKWNKYDDGTTSIKYDEAYLNLDEGLRLKLKGCYLYPFNSVEDYFKGLANVIKYGYQNVGCNTPECISKYYVRNDGKVKAHWVRNVKMFY